MIFWLIFSILIHLFTGIFLVQLLLSSKNHPTLPLSIKIFLGIGIGFGLTSVNLFLWLIAFGGRGEESGFIAAESLLAICLIISVIYLAKKWNLSEHKLTSLVATKSKIHFATAIAFYVSIIGAASIFITSILRSPHGWWDAWAIWNLRARFLFRGEENWTDAFSGIMVVSHPDYPLLVPLSISRYWEYVGYETLTAPALIAALFTCAIIGLTVSSLSFLRSQTQGFLAGLVLLTIPLFIKLAFMQYADIPLSFFLLASIILLCLQNRNTNNNYNFLILAGTTSGFAGWTKNEGLLIIASVVTAWSVITILSKGLALYTRQILFFLSGLIPLLLVIAYFKVQLAPPNDLVSSQGLEVTTNKLFDFSRYTFILQAFVKQLASFDPWYLNPLYLLLIYPFCLGIKIEKSDTLAVVTSIAILSLILTGYFFVYVTTPNDLNWHLNTSLDRLLMQLFPSFVFVYFLIVRAPEQIAHNGDGNLNETSSHSAI